ncbi:MAG: secretin N-terminal domain-containing protein, partial [Candidatus Omnitrophota bacterium]
MRKFLRLPVLVLSVTFSLFPVALRAQDQASIAGTKGSSLVNADLSLGSSALMDEPISLDQTISMDLQDANLRDVLKIFSIQSGLNFIASDAVENKKITLYLDSVPIKLAMDKLFETNKLNYEFDEDAGIFVVRGKEENVDMITEVFRLRYRSVSSSNMEKQRAGLFSGELVSGGTGEGGTAAAAISDIKATIQQILSPVGKVSEDNKTNSLIITDVPSRFPQIRAIIATLDMPQAQVMLDVEMLDVSKDLVDKMGFNFSENPFMTFSLGMGDKATAFPFSTSSLKSAGTALTRTAGTLSFTNADGPFSAALNFLKKSHDVKLLARPRILTLNNETAEIGITKDEVVSRTSEYNTDTQQTTYTYERSSSLSLTP